MNTLPTSLGAIVTFDLPEDSDGIRYRAVATLIAGHVDDAGIVHDAVWASATIDHPDDQANIFTAEAILGANPELFADTIPATDPDLDIEDALEEGTVIRLNGPHGPETFTYAPSFIYDGELGDVFWTNSYGGYATLTDLVACGYTVLRTPSHRA